MYLMTIDPGKSTGIVLGYYDAITPYRLLERWNVLGGLEGFLYWWEEHIISGETVFDELVVESFCLDPDNEFSADLTPVHIEGALMTIMRDSDIPIIWQPRTDKAALKPYPPDCKTTTQRQRFRFDFLDQYGMFAKGEASTDSNDAVTHSLVHMKKIGHAPSLLAFWKPRRSEATYLKSV